MKTYLAFLIAPLVVVFCLNYAMDTGGLQSSQAVARLAQTQTAGDLLSSPTQFDQRAWVRARLDGGRCPDVLVLGSSTVGEFAEPMFGGANVFNAFLVGPMVEDFEALTTVLRRNSCEPSVIIVGADPWWLGNPSVDDHRWMTAADDYVAFAHPDFLTQGLLRAEVAGSRFEERLNFATTRESVTVLRSVLQGRHDGVRLLHETPEAFCERTPTPWYDRAYDGHYVTCMRWLPTLSARESVADEYLRVNMHSMGEWRELAWPRLARFRQLVAEWQRHSAVVVVGMPYNPITFRALKRDRNVSVHLAQLDAALDRLSEVGATFLDLRDASVVGCDADMFEDSHHALPACIERIVSRLRGAAPFHGTSLARRTEGP